MLVAFCKRVPAESRMSPLDIFCEFPDGMNVLGNTYYQEEISEHLHDLIDFWEEVEECANELDTEEAQYGSFAELINEYYEPDVERGPYTEAELDEWMDILNELGMASTKREEFHLYTDAMTLITGHEYRMQMIMGSCQSDWNYAIYDTTLWPDKEAVACFEAEYFNAGEEWEVFLREVDDPYSVNPNDLDDGEYLYTTKWDSVAEIKEMLGVENVAIFEPEYYSGYRYNKMEVR